MKDIRTMLTLKSLVRRSVMGAALVVTAGGAVVSSQGAQAVNLTGAGATFPYPLYSKWFNVYKGSQINYQAIGSGGGINQLKAKTVDFGASDAPLTNAELRSMPSPVVQIPMTAGAVAVIYNGLPRGLRLTGPVLADIFQGNITRWNDSKIAALNAGMRLPSRPITVARRSDGSGTTWIFTQYLKAVSPSWSRQIGAGKAVAWPVGQGGRGSDGVSALVKQQPGSIGYVELAYARQNNLPFAAIRNRAGAYVLPSPGGVTAAAGASAKSLQRDIRTPIVNAAGAASYPISGFSFILVYKNQTDKAKGRAITQFLNWGMNAGQRYAKALDYAPLPLSVKRVNTIKLRSIR